jgi:hypothetical protein
MRIRENDEYLHSAKEPRNINFNSDTISHNDILNKKSTVLTCLGSKNFILAFFRI